MAGALAFARLRTFLDSDAPPAARAAALSALDASDDPRVVEPALAALDAPDPELVVAGLGVLRGWVTRENGTRVLDAVARIALDAGRPATTRRAALEALSDLPRELLQPILDQAAPADPREVVDDPVRLREWLASEGSTAPLSVLHDLVVSAREREGAETSFRKRQEWQTARAALHAALAARGSRVALYDLRETFDTATGPLPLDFLAAVAEVGDATCLEPMARAWSTAGKDRWWRERLSAAADAIVHRTRLSARSAVIRRIRAKWDGFL